MMGVYEGERVQFSSVQLLRERQVVNRASARSKLAFFCCQKSGRGIRMYLRQMRIRLLVPKLDDAVATTAQYQWLRARSRNHLQTKSRKREKLGGKSHTTRFNENASDQVPNGENQKKNDQTHLERRDRIQVALCRCYRCSSSRASPRLSSSRRTLYIAPRKAPETSLGHRKSIRNVGTGVRLAHYATRSRSDHVPQSTPRGNNEAIPSQFAR